MDHLNIDTSGIKDFKKNNVRKLELGNRLVALSGSVVDAFLQAEIDGHVELLLVQNVYRHFQEALIFSMRGEPSMAFSMNRIAVEGCRDLLRILENPELSKLYSEGRITKENRKRWREEFKFNEEKEKYLLDMYNVASDFGIHSRFPISDHLAEVVDRGGTTMMQISQRKAALGVYMMTLGTLNLSTVNVMVAVAPYIESGPERAKQIAQVWKKDWVAIQPKLSRYIENYKDFQ
jgi:hypothetical protein